jgi:hypothetical protein
MEVYLFISQFKDKTMITYAICLKTNEHYTQGITYTIKETEDDRIIFTNENGEDVSALTTDFDICYDLEPYELAFVEAHFFCSSL